MAFGGTLTALKVDQGATIPLTFIPPFPTYPPETAWMREPKTDIPGLVLSERASSRIAYMAQRLSECIRFRRSERHHDHSPRLREDG